MDVEWVSDVVEEIEEDEDPSSGVDSLGDSLELELLWTVVDGERLEPE